MKNKLYTFCAALLLAVLIHGCTKSNYPGGEINPEIGIYDLRTLYKNSPLSLTKEALGGSEFIVGTVISDHSGANVPDGMLVVQDVKRLGLLRGIAIPLGEAAFSYQPGDSIRIHVVGGLLNREDGNLQLQNIGPDRISKLGSGARILATSTTSRMIQARPTDFESTLVVIVKAGFNPIPAPGATLMGEKLINDGFGNIMLAIDGQANFAQDTLYKMANYYGILFTKMQGDSLLPYHRPRTRKDIVELKSVYKVPKVIITGWSNDPKGTDANNEYIQLMATEDIDFAKTPFSLVTTNNANASTPTGPPAQGWATGGMRTYKFNLNAGQAKKGTFFYVGGTNKLINSTGSTSIAAANWITAYDYSTQDGQDFGTKTSNLLANSGNAYGIAVFEGITVDKLSIPEDVMFVASGGSLTASGMGYRIANTDYYDIINPLNLQQQPFYRNGSNTKMLSYNTPSDMGYFYMLGGEFNRSLGRWTKARSQTNVELTKESKIEEIEPELSTKLID